MTTEEQVKLYCEQKAEESTLNKSNKKLAESIKQALLESNETDFSAGKYSIHLETRVTESVDEFGMLTVLKNYWDANKGDEKCPFIKTTEYIDMDALEAFMYKEDLPKDVLLALDGCRVKKETTAITYKIAKGE